MGLYYQESGIQIYNGDYGENLLYLPDGSVHTIVTSPPYYKQRTYHQSNELGQESTPDEYVEHITQSFRAMRRVLSPTGTIWLVLATTYMTKTIESAEYILRDDLTVEEQGYVYTELAKHITKNKKTMPRMWTPHVEGK